MRQLRRIPALTAADSINAIVTNPATTRTLSELITSPIELPPIATRIADLQNEILEKLTPLVPLLSEDCEQCYRGEVVVLTSEKRVQLEDLGFFSEHRLILYENGLLMRTSLWPIYCRSRTWSSLRILNLCLFKHVIAEIVA